MEDDEIIKHIVNNDFTLTKIGDSYHLLVSDHSILLSPESFRKLEDKYIQYQVDNFEIPKWAYKYLKS